MRLEKERLLNEEEIAALEREIGSDPEMPPPTTTAPEGASIEEVVSGMHRSGATEAGKEEEKEHETELEKKKEKEKEKDVAGEPSASAEGQTQPAHNK